MTSFWQWFIGEWKKRKPAIMKTIFTNFHTITRLLVMMLLIGVGNTAFAQIPNSGFEDWAVVNTWNEEPVDWETGNGPTVIQVTKSEDAYQGQYSMKVEAQQMGLGSYGYAEATFPMTYVPASLDFYVKTFNAYGSAAVTIGFYNEDALFMEFYWMTADTLDEWTPVVLQLVQNEPVLTEARIRVETMVGDFVPGESILWIDAMGFATIDAVDDASASSITVYPNPCDDVLHLKGAAAGTGYAISDITGREVFSGVTAGYSTSLDVGGLTSGIYLLKLGQGANESVRKIIVK